MAQTGRLEQANSTAEKKCSFSSLGLNDWLVKQCRSMGITRPTSIQQNCIPPILRGQDCLGCAKTGSGKTAAFALPILQSLSEDPYGIFCLVITPTRELAVQIGDQFRVFGKPIGVRDAVIVGGFDMIRQGLELSKKPHVVISTPGRLADHIKSTDTCDLSKIKFLVLDEADRLLEGNFGPDLEVIFENIPVARQTLLFSATINDTMKELQKLSLNKPFIWMSKARVITVEQLDQRYCITPAQVKDAYLMHIVHAFCSANNEKSVIIFTSTCKNCQVLAIMLREMGLPCVSLHSLVKQRTRLASLAMFKSNQVRVLVATDLASRGLDIPTVELVINHNVPTSPKYYVHRVGRTARAGRGGMAITLVTQFDVQLIKAVEKLIGTKLTEFNVDEKKNVLPILNEVALAKRQGELKLEELDIGEKRAINKRKQMILEDKDPNEEERRKFKMLKRTRRHQQEIGEPSTSRAPFP